MINNNAIKNLLSDQHKFYQFFWGSEKNCLAHSFIFLNLQK